MILIFVGCQLLSKPDLVFTFFVRICIVLHVHATFFVVFSREENNKSLGIDPRAYALTSVIHVHMTGNYSAYSDGTLIPSNLCNFAIDHQGFLLLHIL